MTRKLNKLVAVGFAVVMAMSMLSVPVAAQGQVSLSSSGPSPSTVSAGETFTVSYTVENTGDEQVGARIDLENLPSGFDVVRVEPDGGIVSGDNESVAYAQLQPGETRTATFEIETPAGEAGDFSYTANASALGTDSTDSVTTSITVEGDGEGLLPITTVSGPGSVAPGEQTTVTYRIQNTGDEPVGAQLSIENLPDEFTVVNVDSGGGTESSDNRRIAYSRIQPGDTRTATFTLEAAANAERKDYTYDVVSEALGADSVSTTQSTVTVGEVEGPVNIGEGELSPNTTTEQTTVDHTVDFEVDQVSDDGETDTLSVTLPDISRFQTVNSVSVTNDAGDSVTVSNVRTEDADDGTDNRVLFDINPDTDGNEQNFTVTVEAAISHGDAPGGDVRGDVVAAVDDSVNGSDSAPIDQLVVEFEPTPGTFVSSEVRDVQGQPISTEATGLGVRFRNLDTGRLVSVNGQEELELDSGGESRRVPVEAGGEYQAEIIVLNPSKAEEAGLSAVNTSSTAEVIEDGETLELDVTVVRQQVPDNIVVDPEEDTQFVGEENPFTVTVTDRDGEPIAGVSVLAQTDDDSIGFVSESTLQTDENGQATFVVNSDVVTTAEIEFIVLDDPDVRTTAVKNYILNGNGEIDGTVQSSATTDPVEDASVWAVLESRFESNRMETTLDITALDSDDDTVFVRLVDNETGRIIDPSEYRVQLQDGNDRDVRKVRELNTSDASVGGGFALRLESNEDTVTFFHTRLEDREYYAQVSTTAPRNSEIDEFGDSTNAPENFNVRAPGDESTAFEPTANLTVEATEELAQVSEANLVDAPGFVNSFGENTGGTNEFGQFKLNELFTDGQDGASYVVIGAAPGFNTDFADVFVDEDGDFNDGASFEALNLDPIPIEAEQVDVTQTGTHPPVAETGGYNANLVEEFNDQTDSTFQRVPRDGETVDVIDVTTSTDDGTPVDGTVELEILDDDSASGAENFDGEVLDVVGGQIESTSEDTVTLSTGDDGEARVLLETDSNPNILDTQKVATLTNDPSATDSSNVTFVGTTVFEVGSINGDVTNENNEGIPNSVVYPTEFTTASGDTFTITPQDSIDNDTRENVLNTDFEITAPSGQTVAVSGARLRDGYNFSEFKSVQLRNATSVTLLAFPAGQEEPQYTLPRVPAQGTSPSDEGVEYLLTGVQLETGQDGFRDAGEVLIDFTQEGNVVIIGAVPIDTGPEPGSLADRFDADEDSDIDQSEVIDAINAFNSESDDRLTSDDRGVVISIINEFNGDAEWASVEE